MPDNFCQPQRDTFNFEMTKTHMTNALFNVKVQGSGIATCPGDFPLIADNPKNGDILDFLFKLAPEKNDTMPPKPPSDIRLSSKTINSLSIVWQSPLLATDGDSAIEYALYLNDENIAKTSDTTYIFQNLEAATSYKIDVYSVDKSNIYSNSAVTGYFETSDVSGLIDSESPLAPKNLKLISTGNYKY